MCCLKMEGLYIHNLSFPDVQNSALYEDSFAKKNGNLFGDQRKKINPSYFEREDLARIQVVFLFKGCFSRFYSVMSKKDFKDHLNNNTPH